MDASSSYSQGTTMSLKYTLAKVARDFLPTSKQEFGNREMRHLTLDFPTETQVAAVWLEKKGDWLLTWVLSLSLAQKHQLHR